MIDSDVSKRIATLRFLMIFGVVFIHTPPTVEVYDVDGSLWAYIVSFLQNGIFRAGVPVLTIISGFLLFSANSDLHYVKLLKKKAATLLVPFLVFNLGHIAAQLVVRLATGQWLGENLLGLGFDGWMNVLFSVREVPANGPLHFLRELIVLAILSPVLSVLIRRAPVFGLLVVGLFFLSNADGRLMNRGDMAVNFYIGGLAAVYHWNLKALDRFAYLSLAVFCGICAAVSVFQISDLTWLRLTAPYLVWSVVSRLVDTRFGKWLAHMSRHSFFIFVSHAALVRMAWIAFEKTLPSVPVAWFTVIAPFAVVAMCIGLYKVLHMLMPKQLDWALGQRGAKARAKTQAAASPATARDIPKPTATPETAKDVTKPAAAPDTAKAIPAEAEALPLS